MVTILILPLNQLRCRLVAGPMEPCYSVKHSSRLEYVMNTPPMLALSPCPVRYLPLLLGLGCFSWELPIRLSCLLDIGWEGCNLKK